LDEVLAGGGYGSSRSSAIDPQAQTPGIREISGDLGDAQSLFARRSQGGKVVGSDSTLTRAYVQLRTVMSRSPNGAATIDVDIPGTNLSRVEFNP
jgi:hypothetical protein